MARSTGRVPTAEDRIAKAVRAEVASKPAEWMPDPAKMEVATKPGPTAVEMRRRRPRVGGRSLIARAKRALAY
eukprot:scaffold14668_cov62-Isochrysis_galbana.AAC.1